jgi:hypothetical protein
MPLTTDELKKLVTALDVLDEDTGETIRVVLEEMAPALARKVIALTEAAGKLAECVARLDREKPGTSGGRLVLEKDILDSLAALATLRAVLGENE